MSCQYYQKLLHLHRPGELSDRQEKRLRHHLAKCPTCAAERAGILEADRLVSVVRQGRPESIHQQELAADIMRTIRRMSGYPPGRGRLMVTWERVTGLCSLPKVRLALAGMTLFLVGAFFLQEFVILYRVTRLEQRMAAWSAHRGLHDDIFTRSFAKASVVKILKQDRFIKTLDTEALGKDDERVILKKSTLKSWFKAYERLWLENEVLLRLLQERLPALEGLDPANGLDRQEIEQILKNRKRILKYIEKL